jgi:hypothetical protein
VKLRITRPGGVPGPTLTIDGTRLDVSPGLRATDATLALEIRSSRGGQHAVVLPDGAELQSVTIQGQTQPIRQEGRAVTLPILPGSQTAVLAWREPRGIAPRFTSPEVNVGAPSVNADLHVAMPRDRWTLFLGGGRLGPAVLFWSVLVVLLLVAIALGRIPWTPLGAVQWFLLGIGLTQLDVVAAAVVVGWLLALGWRRERGGALGDRTFDLVQVVLAGWTLVAFAVLVGAIEQGLLGLPEMQIAGNGSTAFDLRWTHDRAGAVLPRSWVVSAPLLAYRLAMLAWALWLSWAFLRWIRWGWECFTAGGAWRSGVRLWRRR